MLIESVTKQPEIPSLRETPAENFDNHHKISLDLKNDTRSDDHTTVLESPENDTIIPEVYDFTLTEELHKLPPGVRDVPIKQEFPEYQELATRENAHETIESDNDVRESQHKVYPVEIKETMDFSPLDQPDTEEDIFTETDIATETNLPPTLDQSYHEFAAVDPDDKTNEYAERILVELEINEIVSDIESSFEDSKQELLGTYLLSVINPEFIVVSDEATENQGGDLPIHNLMQLFSPESLSTNKQQEVLNSLMSVLEITNPEEQQQFSELLLAITDAIRELQSGDIIEEITIQNLYFELENNLNQLFGLVSDTYDIQQTKKFIRLLTLMQKQKSLDFKTVDIDYLNRVGTREYKSLNDGIFIDGLVHRVGVDFKHVKFMGKYSVQECFA